MQGKNESHSAAPLLVLIKIMQTTGVCYGSHISTSRATRRSAVILKSPFHYKLPKHHIKYEIYTHRLSFNSNNLKTIKFFLGLITDTPYKLKVRSLKKLIYDIGIL